MNIDILLTGAVVLVAFIYVVRKIMRPGCTGCAKNGCGRESSEGQCPPLADYRHKKNDGSQG